MPDTGDEIERLAVTVNEMLDRIEVGRVAQRQFTSDAAHELRTPLMALQGEVELLASGVQSADADVLARLDALCRRLGDRIDDLVLLSTLDEARPLASPARRPARHPARRGVDHGRRHRGDAAPTSSSHSTPSLVARAARNLLANARRHARLDRAGDGRPTATDESGCTSTTTAPASTRPTATTCSAGSPDSTRHAPPTAAASGLGLAIVASVATAHAGGVTIDHSPQGGARVSLWFPLPDPPH